jgi:hypothetical protein
LQKITTKSEILQKISTLQEESSEDEQHSPIEECKYFDANMAP